MLTISFLPIFYSKIWKFSKHRHKWWSRKNWTTRCSFTQQVFFGLPINILGTAPGVRNIIMNKIILSFEVFELVKRDQHDKLTSKVQRWGDAQDTVEIKMILCVKEIGSDNSARTQGISGSLPGQRQGERGVGRKCSGLPLWTCKNKGGKNNIVRWEQKTGTTGNPTF